MNMCSNLVTKFTPESDGDHYIAVSAKAPTVAMADGNSIKSMSTTPSRASRARSASK